MNGFMLFMHLICKYFHWHFVGLDVFLFYFKFSLAGRVYKGFFPSVFRFLYSSRNSHFISDASETCMHTVSHNYVCVQNKCIHIKYSRSRRLWALRYVLWVRIVDIYIGLLPLHWFSCKYVQYSIHIEKYHLVWFHHHFIDRHHHDHHRRHCSLCRCHFTYFAKWPRFSYFSCLEMMKAQSYFNILETYDRALQCSFHHSSKVQFEKLHQSLINVYRKTNLIVVCVQVYDMARP